MTERDVTRLVAWATELRVVHQRLRKALRDLRASRNKDQPMPPAAGDLLLFCHGFCTALTDHHQAEDRELFPDLAAAYPELRATIERLSDDHVMIAALIAELQAATKSAASAAELDQHLDGIAAIMESHFRYEERELLGILDAVSADSDTHPTAGSPKQPAMPDEL